jgi:hypothetical protein
MAKYLDKRDGFVAAKGHWLRSVMRIDSAVFLSIPSVVSLVSPSAIQFKRCREVQSCLPVAGKRQHCA